MTMLEDALRETFAGQVSSPPAVLDPAGSAIGRARRVRHRQRVAAGTAFALAVTLVFAGTWWVNAIGARRLGGFTGLAMATSRSTAEPAPAAVPYAGSAALQLDLFDGSTVVTPSGHKLPIADVAAGSVVDRVPAGWLYPASSAPAQIRLMRDDGTSVDVGIDAVRFVVSSDGTQVAWAAAQAPGQDLLKVADLTGETVRNVNMTPVPAGTEPVAIVGTRVIVSSGQGYDYWESGRWAFEPTWNQQVRQVYGRYGDFVVAEIAGPSGVDGCLALLTFDSSGLRDGEHSCVPALAGQLDDVLSPTGRWLAVSHGSTAQIVDLSSGLDPPTGANCVFGSTVLSMAWEDAGHLAVRTATGWRRCATDAAVTSISATVRASDNWELVSRHG